MKNLLVYSFLLFSILFHSLVTAQNPNWVTLADGQKVKALAEEGNYIWAGTSGGLVKIEKATRATTFYNQTDRGALLDQINCIAVDASGIKWIGTQNIGLVKFDNTNLTIYNTSNTALNSNTINSIVIDASNVKWILNEGILVKMSGTTFTNYNYNLPSWPTLYDVAIDPSGNKWVAASSGVGKFNGTSWTYYQASPSTFHTEDVTSIEVDANGHVWVACRTTQNSQGGLSKFDGTTWTRFTTNNINLHMLSDIFKDVNGKMWVAGGGIFSSYNGTAFTSTSGVNTITTLLADAQGNVWTGSYAGVTKTIGTVKTQIRTSSSVIDNGNDYYSKNVFTKVIFDREGNPVIAFKNTVLDEGYLYYLKNGRLNKFSAFNSMMNGRAIYDMVNDASGNLWYGAGPVLMKFDGNYWTRFAASVNNTNISAYTNISATAMDHNGNLWVGTYETTAGIGKFDGTNWTWYKTTDSGLRGDEILSIAVDQNNNVWASTNRGLCKFDGTNWTGYGAYSAYSGIAIDQNNILWLAGSNGLERFNGSFNTYNTGNSSIPGNSLTAVKIDASGNVWMGIENVGLVKYNGSTWTSYTPANSGIPSFQINDINIDGKNNMFISTNSGLCIFNGNGIDLTMPIASEPKVFEFTYPKSGETLTASCTSININWTTYGTPPSTGVNLFYTTDGGTNWISIANNISYSTTSYSWIPPAINSTQCMIKAVDKDNPAIEFKSLTHFTISYSGGKSITMTSPAGTETLNTGQTKNITWTNTGAIAKVSLLYSYNNGAWNTIASNVDNTGSYTWTVPGTAGNYILKVQDYNQSCVFAQNNVVVNAVPFFLLTYPTTSGNSVGTASVRNITWSSGSIVSGFVNLDLSIDGGLNWSNIVTKATNNGTYSWTVPNTISSQCLIRVSDWSDANVYDVSDVQFSIIAASITLLTPQAGGNVNACGSYNITWQSQGVSGTLYRVYSSHDNGVTWEQVTIASGTSYSWYVSSIVPTATYRLKISAYSDASIFTISEPFNVVNQGPFTITYPNGGENLKVGSICDITWTKTGTQSYVNLFYSLNGGISWTLIGLANNNALHFLWTVPASISSTVLIKMVDNSSCLLEISDAPFTISSPRVWPGDVDNSSKVTLDDLLPLGLYNGNTGSTRDSVSTRWIAHASNAWNIPQVNGNDMKYADCNGDGIINAADTNAIARNFALVQSSSGLRTSIPSTSYSLYFVFPVLNYLPGEKVNGELWIADADNSFPDCYGASFDISFDPTAIEPNSFFIDYSNSWLGNATQVFSMSRYFETQGKVYSAIVRNNQTGQSGYGKIADVSFTINGAYNGSTMSLDISRNNAIDATGTAMALQTNASTLSTSTVTSTEESYETVLRLFPNPAKESFVIQLPVRVALDHVKVELINNLGAIYTPVQVVYQNGKLEVKTDSYLKGMFNLRIDTGSKVYWEKIILY